MVLSNRSAIMKADKGRGRTPFPFFHEDRLSENAPVIEKRPRFKQLCRRFRLRPLPWLLDELPCAEKECDLP